MAEVNSHGEQRRYGRSLQHVTASPGKIGQIARAAFVLVLFEHKNAHVKVAEKTSLSDETKWREHASKHGAEWWPGKPGHPHWRSVEYAGGL